VTKRNLLTVGAVAVVAVLGFGFWSLRDGARETPFVTAGVQKGAITQVVSATGTLQAVVTVQVGSQVSGTIEKLNADFNSKVKQGQVIAQLNQDKFRASVDQGKANLLAGQANLAKGKVGVDDTRRTLDRMRELRKRDLVAQSDLDAAQSAYDAAVAQYEVNKAQVAQAQASLNQTTVDLNNTTIRSPVDGTVISRTVDVGQTVAASLQAPILFTIANDLSKMQVHTSVDEADVGSIWTGQTVTFTVDAYPARRFKGKVSQVRNAPTTVQNVVTYNAIVEIDNSELLLKPGMTTNVEFLISRKTDVLKIPNMAIRFRPPWEKQEAQELIRQASRSGGGGGAGRRRPRAAQADPERKDGRLVKIYVLRNYEPVAVEVRVGITDGSYTELIEGEVAEKDQAILSVTETAKTDGSSGPANPFQPQQQRGLGWLLR
jgi:HlyD family secretion protein